MITSVREVLLARSSDAFSAKRVATSDTKSPANANTQNGITSRRMWVRPLRLHVHRRFNSKEGIVASTKAARLAGRAVQCKRPNVTSRVI